jgi:methyl-accepting chemotaxis protein
MKLLHTLSVRASMALFGAVSLIAMTGLAVIAIINMNAADRLAHDLLDTVRLVRAAGTADMMHDALRGDVLAARVATEAAEHEAVRKDLASHVATLGKALADVDGAANAAMREALARVQPDVKAYGASARALVDLADKAGPDQRKAFDDRFARLEKSLGELTGLIEAEAEALVQQRDAMNARARLLLAVAVAIGASLIIAFVVTFARITLRRLGAEPVVLRAFATRIADGNLDGRFDARPHDASVAGAMLRMQHTLAATVQRIRGNAESVASASTQIAQGNGDLSSRTEHQASSLQQTAAAMEQLGATVQLNADNARQANQLAQGASSAALAGGQVVGQTVETMRDINEASRRIADIIGVIDGIAFQTNILALNAAVEAARAGEQGRGFAVVASEVRSLAGRSAEAAKEIKGLITQSVQRVERGSALVDQAGSTMNEVVGAIRRVTDIVAEISSASAEQSQGVLQASAAVTAMDRATQQNAALVEETAAAAGALSDQAQLMVASVASFKLPAAA